MYFLALLLTLAVTAFGAFPCQAQVTGAYSPGVYNEPAYGPIPERRETLEQTPSSPSLQAIQLSNEMEESRKAYIGTVSAFTNQSLVDRNFQLTTVTPGVEFGFFPNEQTQVKLDYLPTLFGLHNPLLAGEEFRGTILGQPTNRLRYVASLGLYHTFPRLIEPSLSILGQLGARYAITDRIAVRADFSRYLIANSRLTATGLNLPLTDTLVGPVKANQFTAGLDVRPTAKTEISCDYSLGFFEGQRIATNFFQEGNFRIGRTILSREREAHLQFVQPSYQLLILNFAHDLSGFGNASLIPSSDPAENLARLRSSLAGQTSLPNVPYMPVAGVGGYFSPQIYFLNNLRIDAGGRLFKQVFYDVGGGLGPQNFKDVSTRLDHTQLVGTANFSIIAKVSKHVTIEQGAYFLQAGNVYRRYVLYQQSRYYF